ncbi:hypothetical protein HRM2_46150 [Desulforapulum autotrophicum HRM2]|uniref:Uncharacterized protein n=1 Tax=Desulforapulum autotrophicum (strain ATCC 43914 / DSM 3382 / VKM B-1955 / HRM2) TaxID=177437 RepID=C0QG92_DESAH|nr:hypothetical protein HRM2_46150 [Desulforapulum autotrophicum HRM2]
MESWGQKTCPGQQQTETDFIQPFFHYVKASDRHGHHEKRLALRTLKPFHLIILDS